jgi:hypothetical protein
VDRLQGAAEIIGLLESHGQDAVQAVLSEAASSSSAPAKSNGTSQGLDYSGDDEQRLIALRSDTAKGHVGKSSWHEGAVTAAQLQAMTFKPVSYKCPLKFSVGETSAHQ